MEAWAELAIIVFNHQQVRPHIAQYEFGALNQLWPKLAQLPSGTRVRYDAEYQPQDRVHAERILSELSHFAEEHGLELERVPQ